jgi:hypothetical protein
MHMRSRLGVVHEQQSKENVHILQREFFNYKMKEGDNVVAHVLRIDNMAWKLYDLGEAILNLCKLQKCCVGYLYATMLLHVLGTIW